jgi:hypothetical protein
MPPTPPPRRSLSGSDWLLVAVAVLAAGGAAWWFLARRAAPPPPALVEAAPPPAPAPAPAPPPPPPPVPEDRVRSLLLAASPSTLLRAWLAEAGAVDRLALAIDNVAEGVVPRRPLASLAPTRPFVVVRRGGRTLIAPQAYARYDAVAAAVAAVDARAAAVAWRELHGVLEFAYQALGYPGASLDQVAGRALGRIASAPVVVGDVTVLQEEQGVAWRCADPAQERLGGIEKQLLRMGPANAARLRAKARELGQALGLALEGPAATGR